uniref:Uncharacterized protein n=1 Tax=Anopheles dirus TaxID=7168 RepID=A0A182NMG2_9DIPT
MTTGERGRRHAVDDAPCAIKCNYATAHTYAQQRVSRSQAAVMSDIADTGSPTLPTRHNLFVTSNGPLASTATSGSLAGATSTSSMTTSQE